MAEHGSTEAVKAILATERGKKLAVFNGDHGKPINLAAVEGFREIVEALREYSDVGDLSVDDIMAEGNYYHLFTKCGTCPCVRSTPISQWKNHSCLLFSQGRGSKWSSKRLRKLRVKSMTAVFLLE